MVAALFVVLLAFAVAGAPPTPLCAADAAGAADGECEAEPSALLQSSRRPVAAGERSHESGPPALAGAPPRRRVVRERAAANRGAFKQRKRETDPLEWDSTASQLVGVKGNAEGDLYAFACNLGTNAAIIALSALAFCFARHYYPLMYSNNVAAGLVAKAQHSDTFFGWFHDSLRLSSREVEEVAGLDAAMLLEFCKLCMQILAVIGVPLLGVLAPLNAALGRAHSDRLSRLGMGNIDHGHWLCWLHAALVWYVVAVVEYFVLRAQRSFVDRRCAWLRSMPAPQSTTVLLECIPEDVRSDEALLRKFQDLFGKDRVEAAVTVKQTVQLTGLLAAEVQAEQALHQAEFQWEATGNDPERRPHFRSFFGEQTDSIAHYTALRREAAEAVDAERRRIATGPACEVNSSSGFVTFTSRRDQELALMVNITFDVDEYVVSLPPDPSDVIYTDLMEDPRKRAGREFIGYACIAGLYLGFMPFVVGTSQLTNLDKLGKRFPIVQQFLLEVPSIAPFINSLGAVVALKFFMMFLPSILMVIFRNFFCLRADAWAQHKLQTSYFWFLAIFEIMVTSVGSSLAHTTQVLVRHPLKICVLLADTLPHASHFYLNFIVFNWGTHLMNLTRYFNLFKFLTLRSVCKQERARELSEPEDQDWYGFGGRSARFTETMVIGLVFCNVSPLITLLTFINFFICSVVYGYLLVFAETRKSDLGGHFWVTQLNQLQKGLLIYLFTMIGVLLRMGNTPRPAYVATLALVGWALAYRRFHSMRWQSLPLEELCGTEQDPRQLRESSRPTYVQPELLGPKRSPTSEVG